MSMLRLQCSGCQAVLQVRAELAGMQGRCPKCGATLAIPASGTSASPAASSAPPPPESFSGSSSTIIASPSMIGLKGAAGSSSRSAAGTLPLSQAPAVEMLAELARRGKSAVLVVFEPPADGDYRLSSQEGANVRCYRTPDMSDDQMLQVLAETGAMTRGVRDAKGGLHLEGEGGPTPFELKGDRLGSTLDEFKAKYARKVGSFQLPYCSDSTPGQAIEALRVERWYSAAGLVHGRIDLPSEGDPPTIAGVKTELLLYQFVDGRLFRITAMFDTEECHLVREALVKKYGPPTSERQEPAAYAWDNGVSALQLVRGAIRPRKPSLLHAVHHAYHRSAMGRAPQRSDDI
ncbi:MAG: hypothetical protein KF847_05915 [Pirellulales bacterium]|nr:hypothetical protein [Pirellulales bacterium]